MTTASAAQVTPARISQFVWGGVPPLVLEAAIRHRVFDVLDAGAKTIQEVQHETGASERGLAAIMNVLVGLEFLEKDGQGRYSLAPDSAAFLVSTKPAFLGGIYRHLSRQLLPNFLQLNEVVATGRPAKAVNQQSEGGEFFVDFVNDLFPMNYPAAQALAGHLSLNSSGRELRVLDLAAGSGVWGIALAQKSECVHVTVVDWPEVIPVTQKNAARFGLGNRFSFTSGDLLKADFGDNYAVATLGHILHSEGRERSQALLEKVFRALAPGGTIAIAEFLVNPERTGPLSGLLFAVNMLVNTQNGDTYSVEEIGGWLKKAGFVNTRTLDAPGASPLILATKP